MATRKCYTWINLSRLWRNVTWTWKECELVEEIIGVSGALDPNEAIPAWAREIEKEKRRRLIKLICKVKGYSETETSKRVNEDVDINIEDKIGRAHV